MLTNGLKGTTEATATTATNSPYSPLGPTPIPAPAARLAPDPTAPEHRIFPASQSAREAAAAC